MGDFNTDLWSAPITVFWDGEPIGPLKEVKEDITFQIARGPRWRMIARAQKMSAPRRPRDLSSIVTLQMR